MNENGVKKTNVRGVEHTIWNIYANFDTPSRAEKRNISSYSVYSNELQKRKTNVNSILQNLANMCVYLFHNIKRSLFLLHSSWFFHYVSFGDAVHLVLHVIILMEKHHLPLAPLTLSWSVYTAFRHKWIKSIALSLSSLFLCVSCGTNGMFALHI